MGLANGIYDDVAGAPFKIGEHVKVISLSDDMGDAEFLGKEGRILYFEYSCGCGQTYPNDPMIGVKFGERTTEFWKEEIARTND